MRYNLSIQQNADAAEKQLKYLIAKGAKIELTEKKDTRTLRQNRYMHAILAFFGLEYGCDLEYTKQFIFKGDVCKHWFIVKEDNKTKLRSTSSLDTKELTQAIDYFRHWANKEHNIYLPSPNENWEYCENEVKKHNQYTGYGK